MARGWFVCDHCGRLASQYAGSVNRARRTGAPLYCNRKCFGLAHRFNDRTKAEKVEAKRLYDIEYRKRDPEKRKASKAEYHRRTYDPVNAAIQRQGRMAYHVEYCRQPEYRAKKREYDRRHRAEKHYGPFAECFSILQDLDAEIASRMSKYDIYLANGTICKRQQRKREHEHLVSGQP